MLQSILSNLAIILLMHVTVSMLFNIKHKISSNSFKISLVLLNAAAVISMFYLPIRIGDFWVDMRFIPLVFFAYIHGWRIAIPTLMITCSWRLFMGGDGMIPGIIFGMVLPTLLALALHPRSAIKGNYMEKILLIIACWLICDVPMIFLIPNGLEIFKEIATIRCFSFIFTAIILYMFVMQDRQRRFLFDKLEKLAGEDPLTNLLNKRKFFEVVTGQLQYDNPNHYIAMLDIDHFKQINDTYGHLIGDKILIGIGEILKKYESDIVKVGRYGGEEFIIYIGNSYFENATQLIEKIRQNIKETSFLISNDTAVQVTISVGLAKLENDVSLIQSVNQADTYLYKAKESGRDCLICV